MTDAAAKGQASDIRPRALERDADGEIIVGSLAEVIQWFLDYDERVAVVRHPNVEELFQNKQEASERAGEEVMKFRHAEDRLAVGIMQALSIHSDEESLHGWIGQLLNALDDAAETNRNIAKDYNLATATGSSAVAEASKIPAAGERASFLAACWLEVLCTAEIRVLGWIYRELYGRAFDPRAFAEPDEWPQFPEKP